MIQQNHGGIRRPNHHLTRQRYPYKSISFRNGNEWDVAENINIDDVIQLRQLRYYSCP